MDGHGDGEDDDRGEDEGGDRGDNKDEDEDESDASANKRCDAAGYKKDQKDEIPKDNGLWRTPSQVLRGKLDSAGVSMAKGLREPPCLSQAQFRQKEIPAQKECFGSKRKGENISNPTNKC